MTRESGGPFAGRILPAATNYEPPGRNGQRDHYYPRALVVLQPSLRTPDGKREIAKVNVVPISVTVTMDAAERTNTAQITLHARDLPLNPAALADVRVSVFMADVEDPNVDLYVGNADHAQFIGFADEVEFSFDNRGRSVRLSCRDYAGRLMEQKYDNKPIRTDATLLDIVVSLLERAPGFERTSVTLENDKPLVAFVRSPLWVPPRSASLWDVIVALGREAGQEAAFELGTLTFRTARNIPAPKTRVLTLGRTAESLSVRRAPAPLYRSAISLRQVNARTGEVTEGWYPRDVPTERRIVYPTSGSFTKADLEAMAKLAFESVATMAVQGTIVTRHMADDFGEDLCGVDSLRSGDTLYVHVAAEGTTTPLGYSETQVVNYLEAGGVPRDDAAEIVRTWATMEQLAPVFFVKRAVHTLTDRGYNLTIDFENVVRAS